MDAINCGPNGGTLMMPAFSGDLSNPEDWENPPVDVQQLWEIREAVPHFDYALTPTRGVGVVAEYFRTYPGVHRSPHPQSSFCATGQYAPDLTNYHPLNNRFGWHSPLGLFHKLDGKVLMLGAPLNTCTSLYLVEYRKSNKALRKEYKTAAGWVEAWDIELSDKYMSKVIRKNVQLAKVGEAETAFFRIQDAVCWAEAMGFGYW